ncbi:transcription factor EGL1-like [Rhododendron vialii]|uniref:transcription factor EGL1-like n=1 Tax=Rhododendron vialii TaxID=182163 RepID=UPI00265F9597|nr:transcription factor EGL1-like [Rhododendron vialii]XP_058223631.1 transcription factor EGL1-like [Rhododendron vialii]
MCWRMAKGAQNQQGVPENLRRQLAVAVRSVQWSYGIFWAMSTKQEGVLEWGDGYYNGEIRTRKTVPAMELKPDKMGLQRSEQLKELYECLLEGEESDQQANMPSAALSPDDLTDAEWYYLVCMSFVFNPGQGLPGRALANGQAIWLCNAHSADSKVFSRSLLAKSASIQTVICFPHLGGVIELGVTELVLEDPSLIQHIKTSLLEFSKPVCCEESSSGPSHRDDDADFMYANVDHEMVNTISLESFYSPAEDMGFDQEGLNDLEKNTQDNLTMGSPDECSNGCEHNHQTEDSFLLENVNDDFSNCVQVSMNSSDCISQVVVNQEKFISPPKGDKNKLKELQEGNDMKFGSLDIGTDDDLHYKRTLSAVLMRNSYRLLDNLFFHSWDYKSSFVSWKKGEIRNGHRPRVPQQMLKKILVDVPLLHGFSLKLKQESDRMSVQHALSDEGIENEKFLVLKSMIPATTKVDKATILGDTIEYLKELEGRVGELESCIDLAEHEARRKYPDEVEQISENNENRGIGNSKKPWINKRKACDIDETDPELSRVVPKDGPLFDMKVKIKEQEVLIELRCPSREYLLLDIIDAMNNLNLDAHTVQSSTIDGILTVTLQSKFRGAAVASARMIKQALSTVAG